MLASLLSTVSISSVLISKYNLEFFAHYAAIVSIPMLIPFADLGIGNVVFKNYIHAKDRYPSFQFFSNAFYFLGFACLIQFVLILLGILILRTFFWENIFFEISTGQLIFVLGCTFAAVPFTLSLRFIEASGRILTSLALQGLNPIVTLIGTIFCLKFLSDPVFFLPLVPAVSYLIQNLFAFSFFWNNVSPALASMKHFPSFFSTVKSFASWTLIFSSLNAFFFQVPRYVFLGDRRTIESGAYSLVVIFALPVLSLMQTISIWIAPNLITKSWTKSKLVYLYKIVVAVILLTFLIYFFVIGISSNKNFDSIAFPAPDTLLFIAILVSSVLVWQIPFSGLWTSKDYAYLSMLMTISMLLLNLSLYIFEISVKEFILISSVSQLAIGILVFNRLRKLVD